MLNIRLRENKSQGEPTQWVKVDTLDVHLEHEHVVLRDPCPVLGGVGGMERKVRVAFAKSKFTVSGTRSSRRKSNATTPRRSIHPASIHSTQVRQTFER